MPYNTEASSIYDVDHTPETPDGKLLVLSDKLEGSIMNLEYFPGKIIFPGTDDNYTSSQYYGKLFVIGEKFYEYRYIDPAVVVNHEHNFIDITYSFVHDKLFAVKEISLGGEHRAFEIWKIEINVSGETVFELFTPDNLTEISGQIASIFSNPYDGRIYIYQKVDAAKLGDNDISLYSFNPSDENPTWEITHLGMATYYPDYDHTLNLANHYYNNRITPYINPYTNHIYVPNGGHSCISKVSFTPIDQLTLESGINWISIPRHEGNTGLFKEMPAQGEEYIYDHHLTSEVFKKENFESEYSIFQLTYNAAEGEEEELVYAEYNISIGDDWYYSSDMENTYSYRGYNGTYLTLSIFHRG